MNKSSKEKLDRIMQIQQQVHDLEKELESLLGGTEAPVGKERKFYRRDRAGSDEILKARAEAIRKAVTDLASTMQKFPKGSVVSLCRDRGQKVSIAQVAQVLRYSVKRGELEEFGEEGSMERLYRRPARLSGFRSVQM